MPLYLHLKRSIERDSNDSAIEWTFSGSGSISFVSFCKLLFDSNSSASNSKSAWKGASKSTWLKNVRTKLIKNS